MSSPAFSPRSQSPAVSRAAIAPVEEGLRTLVKAFRARQLYLPNNPMYQRAIDALRASFASLWSRMSEITFQVTETALVWEEATVLSEPDKASDSIPWLCYKDGIRELTLRAGFEQDEVSDFFGILQRARKATPNDDDLVSMLWEREFAHLQYTHIDLAADGAGLPGMTAGPPGGALQVRPSDIIQESATLSGGVRFTEFDATLQFLEKREIEHLQRAIEREYSTDLRLNVITILLDMFEVQRDEKVREEVAGNLDEFLVRLFASGALGTVAFLLRECEATLTRSQGLTPAQRDRLRGLPERLSAPGVLTQLLQTLDELPQLPPQDELDLLFDTLGVHALETIFEWIGRATHEELRSRLTRAADRLASSHSAELVRLIGSTVPGVTAQAVRRAGALKSAASVPALAKLLADADAAMRLSAVQALAAIASPGALQAIERTIADSDRDVRLAAVRAIAARAYRPAYDRLHEIVKGGDARDADLTEKMAIFEAYGAVCGPEGLDLLDKMLNKRALLRRDDAELRACAAVALGRLRTPGALEALRRAANDKDIVVRNAVGRALRGGT